MRRRTWPPSIDGTFIYYTMDNNQSLLRDTTPSNTTLWYPSTQSGLDPNNSGCCSFFWSVGRRSVWMTKNDFAFLLKIIQLLLLPRFSIPSFLHVHTYIPPWFWFQYILFIPISSRSRLLRNTLTRRYTSLLNIRSFRLEVNTLSAYNYGKYSYPIYLFALHHFLHTIILLDFENLISCFEYVHEMALTESNFQATLPR